MLFADQSCFLGVDESGCACVQNNPCDANAFRVAFRSQCSKHAILVTDNLPSACDNNEFSCPADRNDALAMARAAADRGIIISTVLLRNQNAVCSGTALDRGCVGVPPIPDQACFIFQNYANVTRGHFANPTPTQGEIFADLSPFIATCPDCDANGANDLCDIDCGASPDCVAPCGVAPDCEPNGVPDGCATDCNNNSQPDACDIAEVISLDCAPRPDGIPDECQLGSLTDCNQNGRDDRCDLSCGAPGGACNILGCGTATDCNGNCRPDECDILQGTPGGTYFCNTGCDPNCNLDAVPDACQLVSNDCDSNGVPDDCDEDCNHNGISDRCDIQSGTSCDVDLDFIPDDCIACCQDGWCANIPEADCTPPAVPLGVGGCQANTCSEGSCCVGTTCTFESGLACLAAGGAFKPGALCEINPCAQGACCVGSTCSSESANNCLLIAGARYLGGLSCSPVNPCAVPGSPVLQPPEAPCGFEGYAKNRYFSFVPRNRGRRTALRVLLDLPAAYQNSDSDVRWVDVPADVTEAPGHSTPFVAGHPGFKAARLVCEPVFRDWSDVDVLHVYGTEVVPTYDLVGQIHIPARYTIQAVAECADVNDVGGYSAPIVVETAQWGDVVEFGCALGCGLLDCCSEPQGVIDVCDVCAVVDKFAGLSGSPMKARADLVGVSPDLRMPNRKIEILDVTSVLDAFVGETYQLGPPDACTPTGGGGGGGTGQE